MVDKMEFPNTMEEFIESFSFKDSEEVYTNGVELIPVFRVEQGFEHYAKQIRAKAIDEFAEKCITELIQYDCPLDMGDIDEIAEQMKAGGIE